MTLSTIKDMRNIENNDTFLHISLTTLLHVMTTVRDAWQLYNIQWILMYLFLSLLSTIRLIST